MSLFWLDIQKVDVTHHYIYVILEKNYKKIREVEETFKLFYSLTVLLVHWVVVLKLQLYKTFVI